MEIPVPTINNLFSFWGFILVIFFLLAKDILKWALSIRKSKAQEQENKNERTKLDTILGQLASQSQENRKMNEQVLTVLQIVAEQWSPEITERQALSIIEVKIDFTCLKLLNYSYDLLKPTLNPETLHEEISNHCHNLYAKDFEFFKLFSYKKQPLNLLLKPEWEASVVNNLSRVISSIVSGKMAQENLETYLFSFFDSAKLQMRERL